MLGSNILDVAIGLIFVFTLVSTLCSAVREGIEAWLKTRAAYLEQAIRELLGDRMGRGWAKNFFEHPLIHGLYLGNYTPGRAKPTATMLQRGGNLPSYITARTFALTLIELAARGPANGALTTKADAFDDSIEALRDSVAKIENPSVQRLLLSAIDSAGGSLEGVRHSLEAWYDDAMERVSGRYKRSTQSVIFLIALLVVGALNVNAITIVDRLYHDGALRAAVVGAAEKASAEQTVQDVIASLDKLSLPIGWGGGWGAPIGQKEPGAPQSLDLWNCVFGPVFGLLVTAIAATLGAPFWFDILSKVMSIRAAVKPTGRSPSPGSPDSDSEPVTDSEIVAERV